MARPTKSRPWLLRNSAWAISLTFVGYLVVLVLAHFVPTPLWLSAARGFAIGKLGPLGDSFGPLTAIFAAVAALGAWRSYDAQRQQLTDEKGRHRGTRFDETFFRLLEHYTREIADLRVVVPQGQRALVDHGEYTETRAIGAFKRTVKLFQFADERIGKDADAYAWGLTKKYFRPLLLLRDQEIAITQWLRRQSKGVKVELRGALLVAKLSDEELWFWYYAIASTADADLMAFASKLGIERTRALDADKPKPDPETDKANSTAKCNAVEGSLEFGLRRAVA